MSDKEYMFSLSKIRGADISLESWELLKEKLYLEEDTPFSLGDVILACDLTTASQYARLLPEKSLKKLVRMVVLPSVKRLTKDVSNENILKCIGIVSDIFYGPDVHGTTDLKNIASVVLEYYTKGVDRSLEPVYLATILLAGVVLDNDKNKTNSAVNTMRYIQDLGDQEEIELQKEALLKAFPPVVKTYSSKSEEAFYQAILKYKPNPVLRALGLKNKERKTFNFKWGSFKPEWGFEFNIIEFDNDHDYDNFWAISFNFIFGSFWINLPRWLPRHHFDDDHQGGIRKWGFQYVGDGNNYFLLSWGKKNKYFDLPWTFTHIRHEILMKDGTWQKQPEWDSTNPTREEFQSKVATEIHSVRYTLKRGVVQHRLATITVSEMEWRRKFLKYIPIFRRIKRTVDVQFSDEVGERSGSWKGGCIATGIEMKENELPVNTLRRMMEETRFR